MVEINKKREVLRVLILANVASPSTNDFFKYLAKQKNISIKVLYCSRSTKKWKEGVKPSNYYESHFLTNLNLLSRYATWQINPGVIRHLLDSKVDIIQIHGYSYPTAFAALLVARFFNKSFVYWGEMIDRSNSSNPVAKYLKKLVVKILNSSKKAFIVGSKGGESYISLGLDPGLIHKTSYSPDLTPFLNISRLRQNDKRKNKITVVTTSQLIPRKQVDLTIKAFTAISRDYPELCLAIIGSGPLRDELEDLIPLELKSKVSWLGYVERKLHPNIYRECHIFVLSSREDGGPVVLPEAMATGLPAITTDGVATAKDMIEDGISGYIVPQNDVQSLEEKIRILVADEELRMRMGKKSAESAKKCDASRVAKKHADDLYSIFKDSQRKRGL